MTEATRSITLQKSLTDTYVEGRTQGWLLQLAVTEAVGLAAQIFVFQRIVNPTGAVDDVFTNVATPYDIATYPVDAPAGASPFFRTSQVSLVFRSNDLGQETLFELESDISTLIRTYNQLDELQEQTVTITCPDWEREEPTPPTSSSSAAPTQLSVSVLVSHPSVYTAANGNQGYLFHLEVVEASGVAEELFVMGSPAADADNVAFANVASPSDIAEYGVDAPYAGARYFRVKEIDLVFRNLDLATESFEDMWTDLRQLLETYSFFEQTNDTTVVIS